MADQVSRLSDQVEAVRQLHERVYDGWYHLDTCAECSDPENGSYVMWPCPTIKALDDDPVTGSPSPEDALMVEWFSVLHLHAWGGDPTDPT